MNVINIILLLIVGYVLYSLTFNKTNTNTKGRVIPYYGSYRDNSRSFKNDVIDDIISLDNSYGSHGPVKRELLNPNFLNIQFHNDYRDLATAFNNLIANQRQLFNLPNEPVKYSEPDPSEVKRLVNDFVKLVNTNLRTQVPGRRNCQSGWDEAIPDPNIAPGWAQMRKSLGLPVSLYEGPAANNLVKLIGVNLVQKYETEDEVKYSCDIVLQKYNVIDQIILKVDFIQNKRPLNDENVFFNNNPQIQLRVHIENIFIVGYLSPYGDDAKRQFDGDEVKYYDYDKLEYNNMTDPKYIRDILMKKYKQRTEEMEQRNAMLDEEGQEFHKTLPQVYDAANILGTKVMFSKHPY